MTATRRTAMEAVVARTTGGKTTLATEPPSGWTTTEAAPLRGRSRWHGTGPMAPGTTASGSLERGTEKEFSHSRREVGTMEPGLMMKETGRESFTTQTAPYMTASGENRNGTVRAP